MHVIVINEKWGHGFEKGHIWKALEGEKRKEKCIIVFLKIKEKYKN